MALTVRQESYWKGRIDQMLAKKEGEIIEEHGRPHYYKERREAGKELALVSLGIDDDYTALCGILVTIDLKDKEVDQLRKSAVALSRAMEKIIPEGDLANTWNNWNGGGETFGYYKPDNLLDNLGKVYEKRLPDDEVSLDLKELVALRDTLLDGIMAATSPTRLIAYLAPIFVERFGVDISVD